MMNSFKIKKKNKMQKKKIKTIIQKVKGWMVSFP